MARYADASCRLCRREGEKLFFKGIRCSSEKCAIERRNYNPGEHAQKRGKLSDYGVRLREKQQARRMYGVLERQFRNYYDKAARKRGITGEVLLTFLEARLDNMVYRMGFAPTHAAARQMVNHGHFKVNGKKVDIPSYQCKPGQVIEVKEKSKKLDAILGSVKMAQEKGLPSWISLDANNLKGTVNHLPTREEMNLPIQEQLIVELYSK